jgi:hypothetical protein
VQLGREEDVRELPGLTLAAVLSREAESPALIDEASDALVDLDMGSPADSAMRNHVVLPPVDDRTRVH